MFTIRKAPKSIDERAEAIPMYMYEESIGEWKHDDKMTTLADCM